MSAAASAPAAASSRATGYVYPVPGLGISRTDQGKDFYGSGDLLALGNAVILRTSTWGGGWGPGGLVYKLIDGPKAGTKVYWQENLQPTVKVGQIVNAGQVIAKVTGPIEGGWANPEGTNALARPRYTEGKVMPEGVDFWNFLQGVKKSGGYGDPNATGSTDAGTASGGVDIPGVGNVDPAGAAKDAVTGVISDVWKSATGGALKMLLFASLVIGGTILAGYGLAKAMGADAALREARDQTQEAGKEAALLAATKGAA